MTVNRIKHLLPSLQQERRIILSQNADIAWYRWQLAVARRNAAIWFWLFVFSVFVSLVF